MITCDEHVFIKVFLIFHNMCIASSGNRTRAARVAGEHSTTEPTMLDEMWQLHESTYSCFGGKAESKYLRSR